MEDSEDPQSILTNTVREGFENNSTKSAIAKTKLIGGLVMVDMVLKRFMKGEVDN